jgi:deoxycytidylate deaminase
VDILAKRMAHDNKKHEANHFRSDAEQLVARDEDEVNEPNGQRVGKIFQYADFVINADLVHTANNVDAQVKRFVDLLFGHNGYSPNRLEYGMYIAHSAALRSLDLSRQVGAAIFRKTGEIAALGANEVPKAGGGTYWADDNFDAREYKLGADSNDKRKIELLEEVLDLVDLRFSDLGDDKKRKLNKSQFMDALEYGRIVHAEMSAISDAARLGISIQDATIYCTTFPCHMCAKHIVASGISRVIFLEPYPKSLTFDLHSDAVKIDGMTRGEYRNFPAVEFIPFYGITPLRYREFFYRNKRKDGYAFEKYKNDTKTPMFKASSTSILQFETTSIIAFKALIEKYILEKSLKIREISRMVKIHFKI